MRIAHRVGPALLFLAGFAFMGCAPTVYNGGDRPCSSTSDCDDGQLCRDALCVDAPSVADSGRGGGDVDAGTGGPGDDAGTTPPPADGVEICGDGLDNDGDGEADEQCVCEIEVPQDCYAGVPERAGVGACSMGSQVCVAAGEFGSYGPCEGWTPPSEEVCDGIDNNCDGTADEGCSCTTGETRGCYTGPFGTEGVGACTPGAQLCTAGAWGPCDGSVLPGAEFCGDGVDNDCDGITDDGCGCGIGDSRTCYLTPSGTPGGGSPGTGTCRNGTETCVALPGGGSGYGSCGGAITAAAEICANGIDEDCDGAVDEGCTPPVVDCTVSDVLFLVDTTGSMTGEIAQIKARLTDTIIPGLAADISDARFAIARFDDFYTGGYGSSGDVPFQLVQGMTSNVSAAQAAVNTLVARGGGDGPESQVEALWQTATGSGLSGWVPGAPACSGGRGYPCFRAGATPIILLFTDIGFHNGPGGVNTYAGIAGDHSYAEAVSALNAIGAKVLGLQSGPGARLHLEAIARDTGAVASDGSPIVFDIGSSGSTLSTDVVSAIQTLCR